MTNSTITASDTRHLDTDRIRNVAEKVLSTHLDAEQSKRKLIAETIPSLCDEVDRCRAIERGLLALCDAGDPVDAQRLRDLLDGPSATDADTEAPRPAVCA